MTMPYSDDEIRSRLRLGEDSGWEFKEVEFHGDRPTRDHRSDWADEVAAFANASGGVLLLGVTDAGDVPGMSRERLEEVERLVGEIPRDSIKPVIRLELCSPGALPNNLTIESMGERQSTRNEVLTSVLGRMDAGAVEGAGGRGYFMERRGDGVPIIRRETRELTGREPEFRLIDGSELCLTLPAAEPDSGPASVVITVRRDGLLLADADVLALFPNNMWKRASTDANGEALLELHSVHLPMTVYVAADGCAAHVEGGWIPSERALAVKLVALPGGGSVVFPEGTGHIPGLAGRLNPILDTSFRTYLYASNIAINDGQQQPVRFVPGEEELRLTDADGRELLVRIVAITGRSSILEYRLA